jgi:protein-disulfide isomerase
MSTSARIKSALDLGSTLFVIVAAGALLWTLYKWSPQRSTNSPNGPRFEAVAGLTLDSKSITKRIGTGVVSLIEFSDFQCPFCGNFARETYPAVLDQFIKTGKLTFVSFAFPLEGIHPLARKASEAAECAARQGKYWEMRERLYADQKALTLPGLSSSAQEIGLDRKTFETCLASEAGSAVQADLEAGRRLGVNSTPTLFLGRFRSDGSLELIRRINGAMPFTQLRSAIAEAIG